MKIHSRYYIMELMGRVHPSFLRVKARDSIVEEINDA